MILSGVFKLINQPTIRESKSGFKVCSLLLSAPYGRKQDGEKYKPTQLYMATLFGDRCETLLKYVQKQQSIFCLLSDLHIAKDLNSDPEKPPVISAIVEKFELLPNAKNNDHQETESPKQSKKSTAAQPQTIVDDDIPF